MTARRRRAIGLALVAAGALVLWLTAGPLWELVRAAGAPVAQRVLAGSPSAAAIAAAPGPMVPVRVVLLDGLSRDDADRLPALARICGGGLALEVDVGFPTKSLPAQFALWTGRTPAQAGLSYDNDPMPTPAGAIPAQLPGAIAVVENTRGIAGSFGFAAVLPGPDADADADGHDGARAAAWRAHGFAEAAGAATASKAPLVLVHVLAIDDAAHAGGRGGDPYDRALAYADALLEGVAARVPAGAALLVLADHGHVAAGGHGDAETEVRIVRACVVEAAGTGAEAPTAAGAEARTGAGVVHLIDLARWISDRTGAKLADDARGRPLALALAHPDPDATLPAPSCARWLAGLAVLIAALALGAWSGAPRWMLAWPLATVALAAVVAGMPTLSHRPHLSIAWLATAAPIVIVAVALAITGGRDLAPPRDLTHRPARAIAGALIAPAAGLAIACAILSGVHAVIMGGPPARVPTWTGELLFWSSQAAAALTAAGLVIAVPPRSRPVAGAAGAGPGPARGAPARQAETGRSRPSDVREPGQDVRHTGQ